MSDSSTHRPPTQELMLLDLVQRLAKSRLGRVAAHIHLSQLSHTYGRERYTQIAVESFAKYVSGFEGQLFSLENGDLVFLSKNTGPNLLEAAVDRIQQLFSQDPLLQQYDTNGRSAFCTWYNLEEEYDHFLIKAQELLKDAERRRNHEEMANDFMEKGMVPIKPSILSKLEQALESADVTTMTRHQTVCTIIDNQPPHKLFEEIFVSIADLQAVVTPGIDLAANIWLFRYLTQTLDHRIMRMLIRNGIKSDRPFSLNLNVATILTPEFAKFESVITPQLRGRLVIEMNKLDIFADMGAFLFARDYLHDHGFRLCLDGLTHHTLRYYNRDHLGFDLIKLFWAPHAVEDILPSMIPEVRNMVMDSGQAHTILCRCDDARAIETGQELGIIMFQGREVDRRIEEEAKPKPRNAYRY